MENVIVTAWAKHGRLLFEAVLFHYIDGPSFQLLRQNGLDHDGFIGWVKPAGKQQPQPGQELSDPLHQLRLPSSGMRIPMKPAIDSDLKPASHSDFIPAAV
ncbi:hypothetical protein, partial [Rhizobium leucaenae]